MKKRNGYILIKSLVVIIILSSIVLITISMIYNTEKIKVFKNKLLETKIINKKISSSNLINTLNIQNYFIGYLLDSSSEELETQDILTTITNLKNEVQELKTSNEDLKASNANLKESIETIQSNAVGTTTALNKIYPVGSIYVSTTLKNTTEVADTLGGKWEVYGDGRVLRNSTGNSEQTNNTTGNVTLTTANLPEHTHSFTPSGTNSYTTSNVTTGGISQTPSATFTYSGYTGYTNVDHKHSIPALSGTAATKTLTGSIGMHAAASHTNIHGVSGVFSSGHTNSNTYSTTPSNTSLYDASVGIINFDGSHSHTVTTNASTTGTASATSGSAINHRHSITISNAAVTLSNTAHTHSITAANLKTAIGTITFTGTESTTGSTGSGTAFSVLDPYITVYMYKRVE